MKHRIVIKRLSASDLTLFESHFRTTAGTKQKALNLDKAVLVDQLYPALADNNHGPVAIGLSIFGPGRTPVYEVARKILKQQKNWRLDGEMIPDPTDQSGRFDLLEKGDFVLMDFFGDYLPQRVSLYFVARKISEDARVHQVLTESFDDNFTPHRGMIVVNRDVVAESLASVEFEPGHPVADLLDADDLEDIAQGGAQGFERIRRRRGGRPVTAEELQIAKKSAEEIGRVGEEIVDTFLASQVGNEVDTYVWVADVNAISPYDFKVFLSAKTERFAVEVKSTRGSFRNRIHVSLAELLEAVQGEGPYEIYRVFGITDTEARIRISNSFSLHAGKILESLEHMPKGVKIDGVSIDPNTIEFSEEILVDLDVFEAG